MTDNERIKVQSVANKQANEKREFERKIEKLEKELVN